MKDEKASPIVSTAFQATRENTVHEIKKEADEKERKREGGGH